MLTVVFITAVKVKSSTAIVYLYSLGDVVVQAALQSRKEYTSGL